MLMLRAFAGTSLIALVAGAASAQVTTVGNNRSEVQNNGSDNKATVEQATQDSDRNNSLVVFEGNTNRATVSQVGFDNASTARHQGDRNTSGVRQLGFGNSATLLQSGNDNGSSIDQYVEPGVGRYGPRTANVQQYGSRNSSTVTQVLWNNVATVRQGLSSSQPSGGGVSTIYQYSAGNTATVTMLGGSADAVNRSHIEQTRIDPVMTNNVANASISGGYNFSYLFQVGARNNADHSISGEQNTIVGKSWGNDLRSTVVQEGYRNFATLNQYAGDRNSSRIWQLNQLGTGGDRQVYVSQGGSDNSSTVVQNRTFNTVVVNQAGDGTVSSVFQNGGGDMARANLWYGSVAAPNKSTISQSATNELPESRQVADVTIRGFGNESEVNQTGVRHVASVDVAGGGVGNKAGTPFRNGNTISVEQNRIQSPTSQPQVNGAGHVARVQVGLLAGGGVGTTTGIVQQGEHANIGNDVTVRQDGQFDFVGIIQSMRFAAVDGGAVANVSARGVSNSISLAQYGRQFAFLTQGLGQESTLRVASYDSSGSVQRLDRFVPIATFGGSRGNNSVNAAQYGDRNTADIWQEGTDNGTTLWQKVGSSDNLAYVNQGRFIFNSITNGKEEALLGGAFSCLPCQFSRDAVATVIQSGEFNQAFVEQYGLNGGSKAYIEQHGRGDDTFLQSSRTFTLNNYASIVQFRTISAEASIVQSAGVAPSKVGDPASGATGDPSYFAGGQRPAEAIIRQTGQAVLARIEQNGRGQFAFIDQSGSGNAASILQDVNATNATAVITQSGSGNSYNVLQTQPGQYINVSQTGTNNSVTNVITRP